jgi:hypothetical protein
MNDSSRMPSAIRGCSPCKGCEDRFTACSDRCPKDRRGEYGYDAWKKEIARVKSEKQKYLRRSYVRLKRYNEGESYEQERTSEN